jgi:hypothetical protein
MNDQLNEFHKRYGQVVARALADPDFRATLEADPTGVLTANGIAVPDGVRVEIVAKAPADPPAGPDAGVIYLVVAPDAGELSLDELGAVAGGVEASSVFTLISTVSSFAPPGDESACSACF